MQIPIARWLAAIATIAVFQANAVAGGVRIVTPQGDLNYPDIASAVAAAQEGNVLLVGEGDYGDFNIDGMSLSIWAAPGASVNVDGRIWVKNLAAHQSVTLSGLSVQGHSVQSPGSVTAPLALTDNLGTVRLQDCSFQGGDCSMWSTADGAPGAFVHNCQRVAFLRCLLRGGQGTMGESFGYLCDIYPTEGGNGLTVEGSRVTLYDGEFHGGTGGDVSWGSGICDPERGGDGLHVEDSAHSEVFASGSLIWGGAGGYYWQVGPAVVGPPGCGTYVGPQSVVATLNCVIGTYDGGAAECGDGALVSWSGSAREVIAPALVPELSAFDVELTGLKRDLLWLPRSTFSAHDRTYYPVAGVWLIPEPVRVDDAPVTTLPPGTVTVTVPPVWVPPGATHAQWILQGLTVSRGEARLGSARHVLGLSLTVGPDCNNNGVSDYIDVLFGGAPDLNHNLIPDPCPGG